MSEKPSIFARIKTGVTSFVTHAVGYIPRGIVLTGTIFAGSAALEAVTGMPLLGISSAAQAGNWAWLGTKFATHLAVGSALSGVIGGSYAAYNLGRSTSDQAQVPTVAKIIKPGEGELDLAKNVVGAAQELAVHTGSGLPANLMNQALKPSSLAR